MLEELHRVHEELNPQDELAFVKKYGREPCPSELLFGAVEEYQTDEEEPK